ncbi:hypothetical protein [Cohnella nanjingensis]|uniref:Uncharacterized protein n=1 Tax=Cohnella nanjingensis TaxID=1387779 RepID=A0A7X0S0C1_9BACL|nr:hypothetical protein [Cohnella nanjingensis]MBB6675600.1 hypothetical protein [Cohnella nanjingensis]
MYIGCLIDGDPERAMRANCPRRTATKGRRIRLRTTESIAAAGQTYGHILARMVGAEAHNNGMGGLSLLDGYGYTCNPDTIGLVTHIRTSNGTSRPKFVGKPRT